MGRLYEYFQKLSPNNKFSHAYLIGNTTFDLCKNELEQVISEFWFNELVCIDNNPDIYIVEPIDNNITKDQIKDLIAKLSTTSQISGKKIYIITNCENLSDSVYNTLLKTIEEPEENIYAFLITSNMEVVGKTIKSRCQSIFISSSTFDKTDEQTYNLAHEFVVKYEKNKLNCMTDTDVYKSISDKTKFNKFIKEVFNIYRFLLYNKIGLECEKKINIEITSTENILCKKLLIINSLIEKQNININKDLLLDKLIIDLWRCDNENCIS